MNPTMLYKCIIQNIDMMSGLGDICFELYQLGKLCNQDYSKEIKIIRTDHNIMGKPQKMHKLEQLITKQFKNRPHKIHKVHVHHHRKTDIAAPTDRRKSYAKARHLKNK